MMRAFTKQSSGEVWLDRVQDALKATLDSITNDANLKSVVSNGTPGPFIDIAKDFGAVGDGKTDNTMAFRRAFNAKDAAGGGVLYLRSASAPYNISGSIDSGKSTFVLMGGGFGPLSWDWFGKPFWNQNTAVRGTVIRQTQAGQDGLVFSQPLVQAGFVKDLALIGPGSGTCRGMVGTNINPSHIHASNVGLYNWSEGFNPGAFEDVMFDRLDIRGCTIGFNGAGVTSGGTVYPWTDLMLLDCWLQGNADGLILPIGTLFRMFGGFIQTNTRGITLAATGSIGVRSVHLDGVYFEGNGSTPGSVATTGPDIVLDSTNATIASASFFRCHLSGDSPALSFPSSSHLIESVLFECCDMGGSETIPANAISFTFIYGPGTIINNSTGMLTLVGVNACTDNTGTAVRIMETGSTDPIIGPTALLGTALKVGSNYAQSGCVRLPNGTANSVKFRGVGSYDIYGVSCDTFDEINVGDGIHCSGVVQQVKSGGNWIKTSASGFRETCQDIQGGSANTQNLAYQLIPVRATSTNAVAATVSLGYHPASGHGASLTAEWVGRDTSTNKVVSGSSQGTYEHNGGTDGVITTAAVAAAQGDATLTGSAVSFAGTGAADITFTPPGGYSGIIDWLAIVRVVEN